ncbi:MAG: hypothetical protein JRJ85_17250 [Deltaproteobacteria bacterium]|nr:hypothetical protein [Deltaproteobacteria bacterium]
MTTRQGIPRGAAVAIDDMLNHCAKVRPGQEVLLLAHVDGLYGGGTISLMKPPFPGFSPPSGTGEPTRPSCGSTNSPSPTHGESPRSSRPPLRPVICLSTIPSDGDLQSG